MSPDLKPNISCAIYTRKSSEEGLEQSFNSLDAQRESCEAFVQSQRHEGWTVLPTRYDDGGFSGGNLDRPALKQLLKDVSIGIVKTIVVYKVDRLTRSLTDFAKIVEALDAKKVSFVSVTQQFNTTTSMGRLTLNVLLSFAQFEREVTGERIRDKIAASKRKGMWMGGWVPLGYDLKERKLIPNTEEANLVRRLFLLYLESGSVSKLKARLDKDGTRSKVRTTRAGIQIGAASFSRGALYQILQNRLYLGETRHRKVWYRGEHEGIVPLKLWERVQALLATNRQGKRNGSKPEKSSSLLVGLIKDAAGNPFTPSYTVKNGRRYRYYVCFPKPTEGQQPGATRLPAHDIEKHVIAKLRSFWQSAANVLDQVTLPSEGAGEIQNLVVSADKLASRWLTLSRDEGRELIREIVDRVVVHDTKIEIEISKRKLRNVLGANDQATSLGLDPEQGQLHEQDVIRLTIEAKLARRGLEVRLVVPPGSDTETLAGPPVPSLVKAVARAYGWHERILQGAAVNQRALAQHSGLSRRYVGKVLECAFLAPDIVEAILQGRQPPGLTFEKLCHPLPLSWAEQREQLGFPRRVVLSKTE